ncbi:MAG: hypothetical protein ACREWE_13695, partial [Gammaproteobacteria bacterium]
TLRAAESRKHTLYQVVQEHLETFLAQVETGAGLPDFAKKELDAFLDWHTGPRVGCHRPNTFFQISHPNHRHPSPPSTPRNGSAAKILRRWTDADGTLQCVELGGDSKFSLRSLRDPSMREKRIGALGL